MTKDPERSLETKNSETLEDQVKSKEKQQRQLFGTFSGVFTPTILTILGVIMFLRQGWVVGNAGLAGTWLIILLSFTITTCTALSLSSVTTNIRIGAGGAFSIISQSLGLEVGGSVGIPLYLSQSLAVAMYIFGFRSGWLWVFPQHPAIIVDLLTFALLFAIAFISASLAFRVQYFIMAVIVLALVSVFVAALQGSMTEEIQWWGDFPGSPENNFSGIGFWAVFAVFFPASTGIMAGANMSGELKNPRKSIPLGTLSAIALSLIIYLLLAYWLARSATPEELTGNYTVIIDKSAWGPLVLAGLLGATFSSALSTLVGAPRNLQSLASHNILPRGKRFAARSKKGEPKNAMILTGFIVLIALMLRNLNLIAPLITMFFLLTYAMINLVVLIEQSLQLVSFRPLLRFPRPVALIGVAGCFFAMFIVNALFSIIAVVVILIIHTLLIKRHLSAPYGDVRSGLYVALAEWAAKKVEQLTASTQRTWKANVLLPVENTSQLQQAAEFVKEISFPKGFIKIVGLTSAEKQNEIAPVLQLQSQQFQQQGVFSSWTVITAAKFGENLKAGIETFGGAFFKPNIVFLNMPLDRKRQEEVEGIIDVCKNMNTGLVLLCKHPENQFGQKSSINIWFSKPDYGWHLDQVEIGENDLALLIGYKLKLNWKADIQLVAGIENQSEESQALSFLNLVAETARIPNVKFTTVTGKGVPHQPDADLHVMPLPKNIDLYDLSREIQHAQNSYLFTLDSGQENALA